MGRHVAGKLKQTNKKHKAGVASNRAQNRQAGAGKVAGRDRPAGISKSGAGLTVKQIEQLSESKSNRINQKHQLKKKKMEDTWLSRRVGTVHGPPKVVAVVPLSHLADAGSCVSACVQAAGWSKEAAPGVIHASFQGGKARLCFLPCALDMTAALEAAKCADIVVFVVSACSEAGCIIDEAGSGVLAALRAEGMPEAVCCVQGLMGDFDFGGGLGGGSAARLADARKLVQATLESRVGAGVKCIQEENAAVLIRTISVCIPREVSWRIGRSYLVAETTEILPETETEAASAAGAGAGSKTIRVSGYLRGTPMRLHSLMHVAGVGACRVMSVQTAVSPYEAGRKAHSLGTPEVVYADRAKQDDLTMEAVPDGIAGEQTWPSEGEMNVGTGAGVAAAEAGTLEGAGRLRRKVAGDLPTGMSSYQADWMVDEDGEWLREDEEGGGGLGPVPDADADAEGGGKVAALTLSALEEREYSDAFAGEDLDAIPEDREGNPNPNYKGNTGADFQSHLEFPDEIDTPEGIPARQRFARYRALQSFRSSPWHPKENLPADYARIHQFEKFENSQRWVLNEVANAMSHQNSSLLTSHSKAKDEAKSGAGKSCGLRSRANTDQDMDMDMEDHDRATAYATAAHMEGGDVDMDIAGGSAGASAGTALMVGGIDTEYVRSGIFVSIVLAEVPMGVEQRVAESGRLQIFSLLRHEQKVSVLHFTLQRTHTYSEPIKSKDRMVMQVGFRTFPANPIYSEANLNCDKHKMERYFQEGSFSVATCYGPITFQPCPVLMFKEVDEACYASDGSVAIRTTRVLVATGSLSSVEPNRIVLKKIILTGHPVRVHKRCAVVRHLFHEPQVRHCVCCVVLCCFYIVLYCVVLYYIAAL
jgi:pre-rRNA-processing protein TSR1